MSTTNNKADKTAGALELTLKKEMVKQNYAFAEHVVIPDGVTKIGSYAFMNTYSGPLSASNSGLRRPK